MLTTMKLTGSPEALASYHSNEENYYYKQGKGTDLSTTPDIGPEYVKVHGQLCQDLGIKAGQAVNEQTFTNLLLGKDAKGIQRTRKHKVHGIDLTFSAPKSVSIAALVTDRDPAITQAHDAAVLETMKEIEAKHSVARPTSTTRIKTGKMVYVAVRDGLSRDLDPHLHTHAIVMNITRGNKTTDKIMGLWSREIMVSDFNKVWSAVYRSKLAGNLKQLGYEISYTKKGLWRLDNISQKAETEFSQRRYAILQAKAKGKTDMNAWRSTRKDKQPDSYTKGIHGDWKSRIEHTPNRTQEQNKQQAVTEREEWADKAVWSIEAQQERERERINTTEAQKWQLAVRRATQNTATVSKKEIITEYLTELARGGKWKPITFIECEQRLAEQIKQNNLVETKGERITGWDMLIADRLAVQSADQRPKTEDRRLTESEVNRGLNQYQQEQSGKGKKELSYVQRNAVKEMLTSTNAVTIVQGDAGSGKTTALRAVNEICKEQGIEVTGLAMQGVAARNLENESGIKSRTLASFLSRDTDSSGRIIIVDEASMIDSRNMARLKEQAETNGDRIILVGDKNQLESIGAGRPFDRLVDKADKDNTLISLNENYRQKDPILRQAVDLARNGKMVESLELLDNTENIKEITNDTDRRKEVAAQYSPETLIITGTVQAREELNNLIRDNLIQKGEINDKNGITYIMSIPDKDGIENRKRLRLAKGDRITFLKNEYREYDIRNGERATVTGLTAQTVKVALEDGRELNIDTKKYSAIDYGYALTTYKAQGQTYNKVIVEADTKTPVLNSMRNQYVQITRARNKVNIYTDDKQDLKELADIKTHARDTLDEKYTLEQAERNKKETDLRTGLYIKETRTADLTADMNPETRDYKQPELDQRLTAPHKDIIIRNDTVLNKFSKADWLRELTEQEMQKTEEQLKKRTDLTDKQKEKVADILNTDKGQKIWSSRSLSPEGRIATARKISGDGDPDIMKGLSRDEISVIKSVERDFTRDKSKDRGIER